MKRKPIRKNEPLAVVLEANSCDQLASGLRRRRGIGVQVESSGSLNSHHLDNLYDQAIGALVVGGLEGAGLEVARRTTDIVFNAVRIEVDPGERDRFAHLLNQGVLSGVSAQPTGSDKPDLDGPRVVLVE